MDLGEPMGIVQYHDAFDYAQRLFDGIDAAQVDSNCIRDCSLYSFLFRM